MGSLKRGRRLKLCDRSQFGARLFGSVMLSSVSSHATPAVGSVVQDLM
jgi:hypothetical protein